VLVLFEDLHWADASSLELLDKTLGMLRTLPVLLVVSFRPEFRPSWLGLAIATLITLARLTDEQSAQLAELTVVDRVLSPSVIARIVSRSDGVPLFIEALAKAVLENAGTAHASSAPVEVPATLQSSLIARLDRLPTAKVVAQVGAVIGREFAHALLTSVAQMPDSQVEHGIESLVASGLAFCRGTLPDAAYSTLLRRQRQALHERIGRAIEELWPETLDTKPELLAHHFTPPRATRRTAAGRGRTCPSPFGHAMHRCGRTRSIAMSSSRTWPMNDPGTLRTRTAALHLHGLLAHWPEVVTAD